MDLLGSILSSMDKPPSVSSKEKQKMKKHQEELLKKKEKEKQALKEFRTKVEEKINGFIQDDAKQSEEFLPGDKVQRSIIHETAEIAGLAAYSFGEEDEDRHVVIYKKEFAPFSEELAALRRGEKWDPAKAKDEALKRELASLNEDIAERKRGRSAPEEKVPAKYLEKYEHLIGKETAKDAARKTEVNQQYGFVPSENKKDVRSIEQTLNEIRARKKLKTNNGESSQSETNS